MGKKEELGVMMMFKINKFFTIVSLVTILIHLTGCGAAAQTLEGAELDTVLAFSEPMTDNLLEGLKNGDYTVFSRDFDPAMQKAIDENAFSDLKTDRDNTLGNYVSREVFQVTQDDDFYVVFYQTQFEKQSDVIMRVVFWVEEPNQISGLWFNK